MWWVIISGFGILLFGIMLLDWKVPEIRQIGVSRLDCIDARLFSIEVMLENLKVCPKDQKEKLEPENRLPG